MKKNKNEKKNIPVIGQFTCQSVDQTMPTVKSPACKTTCLDTLTPRKEISCPIMPLALGGITTLSA